MEKAARSVLPGQVNDHARAESTTCEWKAAAARSAGSTLGSTRSPMQARSHATGLPQVEHIVGSGCEPQVVVRQ